VTLNPATPLVTIEEVVPLVGQILVMSVNPGFGGQTFIPAALDRIRRLRKLVDERNPHCRVEVDGGIKASNLRRVVDAGADTLVVGSAVFDPKTTIKEALAALRAKLR
jgi:ribulose-phosphate 3-epimerase